jgi:hypothetical protein
LIRFRGVPITDDYAREVLLIVFANTQVLRWQSPSAPNGLLSPEAG